MITMQAVEIAILGVLYLQLWLEQDLEDNSVLQHLADRLPAARPIHNVRVECLCLVRLEC